MDTYEGLTDTFRVTVWTRLPLTPKIVMGTVSYAADLEACRVTVVLPLVNDELPKDAVTPEGNPEAVSVTVP